MLRTLFIFLLMLFAFSCEQQSYPDALYIICEPDVDLESDPEEIARAIAQNIDDHVKNKEALQLLADLRGLEDETRSMILMREAMANGLQGCSLAD